MKTIIVIGNLGANAVRRMTSDGKELMTFNVAVSMPNADPIWFNCVANFREKLFPYLAKGQCVCVSGDLRPSVFNGNLDLSISVDKCELCGAKPDNSSQQNENQSFDAANQQTL